MNDAQEIVKLAWREYRPSCTKSQIAKLTDHLMNGGSPTGFDERWVQLALQHCGLLITESEKRVKSNE